MEEIKVGEYVRTKEGKITKVINVEIENYEDGTTEVFVETELNPGYLDYTSKDILKHSPNIIDLIEIGDYVNGVEVIDKYKFGEQQRLVMLSCMEYGYENEMLEEHIKTIVTKEQFKNVMYEV